jgi:polyisoprenyl-phosphate glycosyltransferase
VILDNELVVLMPVYNDWDALSLLLMSLDHEVDTNDLSARIVLVDDGSTIAVPEGLVQLHYKSIISIDVVSLRRNLGHQRAIAVGLSYIEANHPQSLVVVMDCDGEDDPKDVPRLMRECLASRNERIVFAARMRRSEGWLFKCFYHLYRLVHFLLTGVRVRVGNFSIVPPQLLKRLVAVSELWNHYAAAVHKAKLPIAVIPTERSRRLGGQPRMDMVSLVVHGLSAMAVFGDRIGVRLLIVVSAGISMAVSGLIAVLAIRLTTDYAIPGWTTYAAGLLIVLLMQMFLVLLVFVFVILATRNAASVIPSRDYLYLTNGCQRLYG